MLRQALILSSQREYAQTMRQGLLKLDSRILVNVETDPLRAMQLAPQQYDLILLDATLQGMDGLQLLQFIKNQAPAAKFVVVSDSGDENSRALAYQNGADFFVERPRTPEAFDVALAASRGLFTPGSTETSAIRDARDVAPVDIVDAVQTHCLSGDSILLLVSSRAQSGDIFIFRGEVFHAQYPGKGGESAFLEMLRWDNGHVGLRTIKLTQSPPRTIETPYRQLLDALEKTRAADPAVEQMGGELMAVATETSLVSAAQSVAKEAPPLAETSAVDLPHPSKYISGETALPQTNSHWKVDLSGVLLEGSQVAEPDRCAFISSFIYRKMADVAVTLELDYFQEMTLLGPHLQQVLVADNLSIRHAVFDSAWTKEEQRAQYIKWCREQSF